MICQCVEVFEVGAEFPIEAFAAKGADVSLVNAEKAVPEKLVRSLDDALLFIVTIWAAHLAVLY